MQGKALTGLPRAFQVLPSDVFALTFQDVGFGENSFWRQRQEFILVCTNSFVGEDVVGLSLEASEPEQKKSDAFGFDCFGLMLSGLLGSNHIVKIGHE
jgi:hypothetical protein